MADTFEANLLKVTAASLSSLLSLTVAREMFGKGYFALGVQERAIVDDNTFRMTASHFQQLTPERLATHSGPAVGFQPQPPASQKP